MHITYERCAGLDVHKKTVVACVLTPAGPETRTFGTMTAELLTLADWLLISGCTHVAMESTGDYWKPVFNILEGTFELLLVNAQHVKAVPGCKTAVKDAAWLAELLQHGLLRASFIPPVAQLDFIQSCGIAERLCDALQQGRWNLTQVDSLLGHGPREMIPHVSPDQGHGIGTRWACLGMPRHASDTGGPLVDQQMGGQRDERIAAQQHRCGTAHRPLMPLARCCPPHRRACVLTRHRYGPAPDTPGQQVFRRLLQSRRPQGLRRAGARGGANPPPAEGNGRLARVIPHRGVRTPLDLTGPFTRPVVHRQRGPRRLGLGQHRLPGRTALPVEPGPPVRPRFTPGRRIIAGGIETPPRDPTGPGPLLDVVPPRQRRIPAIGHKDHRPPRQAADAPRAHLPGPLHHGSRPAAPPLRAALGGTPHRQTRPRPDPWGPGDGGPQPTPAPAQAPAVDHRRVGGAHGITGEAVRVHGIAAAAFDGVIETTDDDAPGHQPGHAPPPPPPGGER
jgi:hypothetical protein